MKDSGIQNGDRILWIDGDVIFSRRQLSSLINQQRVLLSVARGDSVFLTRVPRLQIRDLRLDLEAKADLQDVSYALSLRNPLSSLYYIPYALSEDCQVQSALSYIDENASERKMFDPSSGQLEIALQPGDRILAVDGAQVQQLHDFFAAVQTRQVQIIVVRGESYVPISWKTADEAFVSGISFSDLNQLVASMGTSSQMSHVGNLYLLNPVTPKPRYEFPLTYSLKERITEAVSSQKKQKQGEDVSEERTRALKTLTDNQNQVMLGLPLKDRTVDFNPSPVQLMVSSMQEAWKTLYATVTGYTSPKYLAGPVGMVQVIHHGWTDGVTEVLFLIAVISLNLGILNLLPIPILDGGHICFYLFELITGKKIKAKTMEKLIIPFIVLFAAFFIYLTYQDLARLLSRFF
jgi:regulator of sigma E protease